MQATRSLTRAAAATGRAAAAAAGTREVGCPVRSADLTISRKHFETGFEVTIDQFSLYDLAIGPN